MLTGVLRFMQTVLVTQKLKSNTLWILLLLISPFTEAQLDTLHCLPPIKSQSFADNVLVQSEVILSTPSLTPIFVNVSTGDGIPISGSPFMVVNGSPYVISLSNNANQIALDDTETGIVQTDKGFILSSQDMFLVTYKAKSGNDAQADLFTTKGVAAMGTEFRWGGFPVTDIGEKNSFLSIMAIADGTIVNISDYDPSCTFRLGTAQSGITSNTVSVTLDQGESYILECVASASANNLSGFLGAMISANKNIVVNNGHVLGGNTGLAAPKDMLLEQSVPIQILGTEYISILGSNLNNPSNQNEWIEYEQVIVIATQNGTTISINGGGTAATLNAGEFYIVDGTNYTTNENLYVETSKPAYCYQQLRGGNRSNTVGLNLLPALSCYLSKEVNEIPFIEDNNGLTLTGGVFILTQTGATVLLNGTVPSSSPQAVTGNTDWVTYKESGLTGNVSISSTAPMAAGVFVADGYAGSAGYYSGFIEEPIPTLSFISSSNNCIDTIFTNDVFDSYQWLDNGIPIAGATDTIYIPNSIGGNIYSVAVNYAGCVDTSGTIINCTNVPSYDTITACDYYTWIDGITYTQSSSSLTDTIFAGAGGGVDTIIFLNLTINHFATTTDVQTACDSLTWIDGVTYTASNNTATYSISGGAVNGCDSLIYLNLTINHSVTTTDVQIACDSFTWIDGVTYTASNNNATFTIPGGGS